MNAKGTRRGKGAPNAHAVAPLGPLSRLELESSNTAGGNSSRTVSSARAVTLDRQEDFQKKTNEC